MRDKNGTNLGIGDLVAYNQSGDLVLGYIEKFQDRRAPRQWWHCTTYVRNAATRKLSKVKRPSSLMVLGGTMVTRIQRNILLQHNDCPF